MENGKKYNIPVGIGITTMIVVLFVCTLTIIAVFAIRSVYDRNLGVRKEVNNTKAYYKASGEMYVKLENINKLMEKQTLEDVIDILENNQDTYQKMAVKEYTKNEVIINYKININDNKYLLAKFQLRDENRKNKSNTVEILEWRIANE